MRIESISIHNFRSITDVTFDCHDYTMLVGANNAGKSNVLTALRVFYEDEKFKNSDFPKVETKDDESWLEIEYVGSQEEFENLKDEYKNLNNVLKVRKYLKSEDGGRVRAEQSNIYGYEHGKLSENLFYGAKSISEAKLGSIIYIPEISKADETLKLSGPSPLRDVLTFVMNKMVKTSESFRDLNNSLEEFSTKFKQEESKDGFSLNNLGKAINDSLEDWGVEFKINVNSVKPEDIIKSLVSYSTKDKNLNGEIDVKYLGQGLQRHLIYTLLKLSAQYTEKRIYKKKEFSPELTLILFEEPEAFLHPSQQEFLNASLKSLSLEEGQQIMITTHSPIFVSRNVEDISALVRLKREHGITLVFQVSEEKLAQILDQNNELAQLLKSKLDDQSIDQPTKSRIREILGNTADDTRMEEEAIRYLLWLDSERCSAFFADIVFICEGATEKTFIDYLMKNQWKDLRRERIYVLDAMGKFNVHRYMNLFKELGMHHSVLVDRDQNNNVHEYINLFIQSQKNEYTNCVDFFEKDIENFLAIASPPNGRRDKGPLNVIWHYTKNKISNDKISALKVKVEGLL